MNNWSYYLWAFLILLYVLSPRDLHPSFIDDLISLLALLYLTYKNKKQTQGFQNRFERFTGSQSSEDQSGQTQGQRWRMTLAEAYVILEVSPKASNDEVKRAYKDKILKNHPDKASHLSKELQEKAKELTMQINEAYDLIKQARGL
jgi:DnaJ like chaperone protein